MTTQTEAERLAKALEGDHPAVPGARTKNEAAAEMRRLVSFNQQLMDEMARLNNALTWEQNRSERIGTHAPGCHTWGPSHYECLLRELDQIIADEREACAKVCDFKALTWKARPVPMLGYSAELEDCATAIRARGNT